MNVNNFLFCETPTEWTTKASENIDTLLIDHANCEKKAASTAMNLIYRYVEYPELLLQLSKLVREEMRHFEQVIAILTDREIYYTHLSSARYAGDLRKGVRTHEPGRLIDVLIVSAVIEARSCERFEKLIPVLDAELSDFYTSLLKSESRHFRKYIKLAEDIAVDECIKDRMEFFLAKDYELIMSSDAEFRFHSGIPTG